MKLLILIVVVVFVWRVWQGLRQMRAHQANEETVRQVFVAAKGTPQTPSLLAKRLQLPPGEISRIFNDWMRRGWLMILSAPAATYGGQTTHGYAWYGLTSEGEKHLIFDS